VVFNYIEDKDVFQNFYGKFLAKRILGQLSASDDFEALLISKLKVHRIIFHSKISLSYLSMHAVLNIHQN